jgi:hypothetical protein
MILGGGQYDTHGAVDTQVINNILINNEGFGLSLSYANGHYANTTVDYNLFFNNGWRNFDQGGMWHAGVMVVQEGGSWDPYQTLDEVRTATPWEDHSLEGDPVFWDYDPQDHDLHDGSWPDFHLTTGSTSAIDRGITTLPASLMALLSAFGVDDYHWGAAYDIGRYEAGFILRTTPATQAIGPGGTANYILSLYPPDLPLDITLLPPIPPPNLTISLSPTILTGAQVATLTITSTHAGPLLTGLWYSLPITGSGSGFTYTINVNLLVGGTRIYMPVMQR